VVYARKSGERELTFDFAEGLVNNNLLVVDRETDSVWSQLDNKAIAGPMKETPMVVVPAIQTTWAFWKNDHPKTGVMVVEGKKGRPYHYFNFDPKNPRRRKRHAGHDTTNLGLGLSIAGDSIFLPFDQLNQIGTSLKINLGGQPVTVHYHKDALTAWGNDANGHLLPGVLAYKTGWMAFHPKSRTYSIAPAGRWSDRHEE